MGNDLCSGNCLEDGLNPKSRHSRKRWEMLLEEIATSSLSSTQKNELLDYLKPAQREVSKNQPNKELVKVNLKQVSEAMKSLNETTEAGKSLWIMGVEVFKAISPWVGVATAFFGL
jgi:hypothetical protein